MAEFTKLQSCKLGKQGSGGFVDCSTAGGLYTREEGRSIAGVEGE